MIHSAPINFVSAGVNNQNKYMEVESARNNMEVSSNQKQNLADASFGGWEKHTKGIGAKLLLSMGFQPGRGLGKNLDGRTEIVEVHMRKGKGGVGTSSHERQDKQKSEMKGHADDYKHKNFSKFREKVSLQVVKKKAKVECQECGKTFGSLDSLISHAKAKHNNENRYKKISKARREKVAKKRFFGEQVPLQEAKKHNLMKDKNSVPSEKKSAYGDLLKCDTCYVSFITVKERVKHEFKCNISKRKCLSG